MLAGRPPFARRDPAGARPCRDVRGAARSHRRGGGRRRRPHAASRAGQGAGGSLPHGGGVRRRSAVGAGAGRQRPDGGGAADPAPGRAAVPAAQAGSPTPTTSARASPTRWPARCPGSSRWSCDRRSSRRATPSRRSIWTASPPTWPWTSCSPGRCWRPKGRVRVSAELVAAPAGDVWWSHVTDAAPDAVLELHDDLARQVLAALPLSWRDSAAPRAARRQREGVRALPARHAVARRSRRAAPGARVLRPEPGADPGFAAAWAERGRIERVLGKFEDPSLLAAGRGSLGRRWPSTPTTAPRSTISPSSRSTSAGSATPWPACSIAHGSGAPNRTSSRAGPRLPLRRAARRLGGRAPRRRPARSRPWRRSVLHTYYHQRAFEQALDELHRSSDPFEARLLGAMGRARRGHRRRPARGERATPPFRCCGRSPPPCAPASRARRRGPRGDAALRAPDEQRRRDAVLRGRGLRARRRHRPRLRASRRGRGCRLPVLPPPSSATPTWRRCGRRPRGPR